MTWEVFIRIAHPFRSADIHRVAHLLNRSRRAQALPPAPRGPSRAFPPVTAGALCPGIFFHTDQAYLKGVLVKACPKNRRKDNGSAV
jgi:hypothetical protein